MEKFININGLGRFFEKLKVYLESAFMKKNQIEIINDINVSNWTNITDSSNAYNYYSDIEISGCTDQDYCEIIFNETDALSGYYSPICDTLTGCVRIYSKVSDLIQIPSIIIYRLR